MTHSQERQFHSGCVLSAERRNPHGKTSRVTEQVAPGNGGEQEQTRAQQQPKQTESSVGDRRLEIADV